eukprot:184683_1
MQSNVLSLKVGSLIDVSDKFGKWNLAKISRHKQANEPLPSNAKFPQQVKENKLNILEVIHVHFVGWDDKWDEWVFIGENTVCTCHALCRDSKQHRLAPPNTQAGKWVPCHKCKHAVNTLSDKNAMRNNGGNWEHNQCPKDSKKEIEIIKIEQKQLESVNVQLMKDVNALKEQIQSIRAEYESCFDVLSNEMKQVKQIYLSKTQELDDQKEDNNTAADESMCALRFEHWLCSVVQLPQYLTLFQQNECNDVRMIEFLDEDTIKNEVGISKMIHCKLIAKAVGEYRQLQTDFSGILDSTKRLKQYKQELAARGIITWNDFQNDICSKHELTRILNIKGDGETHLLWSECVNISQFENLHEGGTTDYH